MFFSRNRQSGDDTSVWSAKRLTVLVLLLLQMAAPALQAADMLLEAEGVDAPVHVESERSDDCEVPHHDALCQLVRTLTHVSASAPVARSVRTHTVEVATPLESAAPRTDQVHFGSTGSRAPPLA